MIAGNNYPRSNCTRHSVNDSTGSKSPNLSHSRVSTRSLMGIGLVMGLFGGLLLAHAAYSTIQYRGMLKIMEEEFSAPPINVVSELVLGLGLCMWAGLAFPGKFLSILTDSEDNRVVALPANMDFMIFNHRGRVIPSNTELKLKP